MPDSFQLLVTRHQGQVYRSAYRILGDRGEALDVTQEAFLALHLHPDVIGRGEGGVAAWLTRVVTNASLDRVRRRGRVEPAAAPPEPADERTPDLAAAASEEAERALTALSALSQRQREVLTLRLLEQQTFPALAATLGITEGAAKVHFRRGLRALRQHLTAGRTHE